ncbi:hypothetical protein M2D07_020905 [Pseudomonas sp. BGr12]|uniref:hypothetical protein n=1 Tax=unclassified Pseudomonas TaxID=196821 RepID=UPI001CE116A6|nr:MULTISPECIES: hypothetical protein [unclassified Pseudomonas]MDL2429487.1 hypothetical protein [Pseudomonas sp. BJa5]
MPPPAEAPKPRWQDRWLLASSALGLERVALLSWGLRSIFSRRARWKGRLRYEWGADSAALTRADAWRTMASEEIEQMIDRRMHLGRLYNRGNHWPELEAAAQELAAATRRLQSDLPGRPVIISPFHYVSEYANIYVVDALRATLGLAELALVSGSPREAYGHREDILIPGLRILHTYDENNRSGLGLRVMRALRQEGIAVLFSDVPPYMMQRYPMETVEVVLLRRPARLHRGVFSIGSHVNAVMLCFHLTFSKGRFGHHLFDPIELACKDAPQRVADCIEAAYQRAYPNWILADHPSRYGFAPRK